MPSKSEVETFINRSREALAATEKALAEKYDEMAAGANNLTASVLGQNVMDTSITKAAKADYLAGWMMSKGSADTFETLRILRKITSDPAYAATLLD